jgi:HD superfamily phosphohydrolase
VSALPHQLEPSIAVQDAVHGRIWLTELERDLINTPEFQRLRQIGQLGLASYVFPTSTHSRFAHSLGAAHVMGMMLRQSTLQDYFTREGAEFLIPIMRLAALLHDLGHFPFSHLGENIWAEAARQEKWVSDGLSVFDLAAQASRPLARSGMSHEMLTAKLILESRIAEIIDRGIPIEGESPSQVVADIITGDYPDLVCRNLLSSDLDCDRLDYLIRDSISADLAYGLVDLAYLIENLVVADHPVAGSVLAVKKKHGRQAVEHYLLARYYHYAQFITHKTTDAAELLLGAALLELIRLEQLPSPGELPSLALEPGFLDFTESMVWAKLYEARTAGWATSSTHLREVASRLVARELLKCAVDESRLERSDDEHALDGLREPEDRLKLAQDAGVDSEFFAYKRSVLPLVGVLTKRTQEEVSRTESVDLRAWIKTVKVADEDGPPEALVEQEGLVNYLSERQWVTRRIFVREESGRAKTNRCRVARLRKAASRLYAVA